MNIFDILLISFGVAVDAFAVSIGGSVSDRRGRLAVNGLMAALFFGGFQIMMPLSGYFAATLFGGITYGYDRWLALGLLVFVGGRMIVEAWRCEMKCSVTLPAAEGGEDGVTNGQDCSCVPAGTGFFHWRRLFVPAIATSMDALAVGGGLFFSQSPILLPALSMGIVTAAVSFAGVCLGRRVSCFAGERTMQMIGGIVIVLVGVKICFF